MSIPHATIDWPDLREAYLRLAEHKLWDGRNADVALDIIKDRDTNREFSGASVEQMIDWITNGYRDEQFDLNSVPTRDVIRKRFRYTDNDGDIDVGRLLGGSDAFYLERADQARPIGVKLSMGFGFRACVPHWVIKEYGAWVVHLITALEDQGFDMGVVLSRLGKNTFRHCASKLSQIDIRVKRMGEISDFMSWSALFSPGGVRHLSHISFCMGGDRLSLDVEVGLGKSQMEAWNINKTDDGSIIIECDSVEEESFPAKKMTERARALGLIQ